MDRIDATLHVGSLADAGNVTILTEASIETVVRLTQDGPSDAPAGPTVHAHPMLDGPRNDPRAFAAAVCEVFARVGAAREEADPHPALVRRAAAFVERA